MSTDCPDLELLFTELSEGRGPALDHAKECEHCAGVLEEHRQLEKDLFRLADPLPPASFVHQVMAKVAAAPAPARAEVRSAVAILVGALGLSALSLAVVGVDFGEVGLTLASSMVRLRELFMGLSHGLSALWRTAAVPLTCALSGMLFFSLYALKRLGGSPASVKASS